MADDDVTPTVEDVIAEAATAALPEVLRPVGAGLKFPFGFGTSLEGTLTRYGKEIADAVTPAVVAAVRNMSAEQIADLTGGTLTTPAACCTCQLPDWDGDQHHALRASSVTVWRAEP